MTSTPPVLIPVEEYLRTVYHPDCDYVDGEVRERNMGELPHARLQAFFLRFLSAKEDEWQLDVVPESRLQVSPTRYRIPDIMAIPIPHTDERVVRTPPLLCIEILSSEDRMKRIQERVDDYTRMGVLTTWVVDPWRRLVYVPGADGVLRATEDRLTVPGREISITVAAIWDELERLERRALGVDGVTA